MTDPQLQTFVGLFSGLQACLVEIVTALHARGAIDQQQLAQQLLKSSQTPRPTVHNAELIALSLRQLADGLSGDSNDSTADQLQRLLH